MVKLWMRNMLFCEKVRIEELESKRGGFERERPCDDGRLVNFHSSEKCLRLAQKWTLTGPRNDELEPLRRIVTQHTVTASVLMVS